MTSQYRSINNFEEYATSELKLAALILAEIPGCSFEVGEQGNSIRKVIRIKYPADYRIQIQGLENNFINKRASANVYLYNRALNTIRDRLRGLDDNARKFQR